MVEKTSAVDRFSVIVETECYQGLWRRNEGVVLKAFRVSGSTGQHSFSSQ